MANENQKYRIKNWKKNRESERAWNRNYYRRNRDKIYDLLGNKCNHCGITDRRVFQIDHVNGGGNSRTIKDRGGQGRLKKTLTEIEEGSKDYQLLCANCNVIKRYTNKEIKGHIKHTEYGQDRARLAQERRDKLRK